MDERDTVILTVLETSLLTDNLTQHHGIIVTRYCQCRLIVTGHCHFRTVAQRLNRGNCYIVVIRICVTCVAVCGDGVLRRVRRIRLTSSA